MPVSIFSFFLSFSEKDNKRSPNGIKPSQWFFLDQKTPRGLGVQSRRPTRRRQGWRARPCLVGPSWLPWPSSASYIFTYIPKPTKASTKTLFHRRNLLFPWDPILGPFPASCRRGIRSRRASTSTLLPIWWSVSSLPQTYGSIEISWIASSLSLWSSIPCFPRCF